jgi:hypothetical protein
MRFTLIVRQVTRPREVNGYTAQAIARTVSYTRGKIASSYDSPYSSTLPLHWHRQAKACALLEGEVVSDIASAPYPSALPPEYPGWMVEFQKHERLAP